MPAKPASLKIAIPASWNSSRATDYVALSGATTCRCYLRREFQRAQWDTAMRSLNKLSSSSSILLAA